MKMRPRRRSVDLKLIVDTCNWSTFSDRPMFMTSDKNHFFFMATKSCVIRMIQSLKWKLFLYNFNSVLLHRHSNETHIQSQSSMELVYSKKHEKQ